MIDYLLQVGISNAVFALGLALVAVWVNARTRQPHLAYLLWLLVFIKLVTPPIVNIPVVFGETDHAQPASEFDLAAAPALAAPDMIRDLSEADREDWRSAVAATLGPIWNTTKPWFVMIWAGGGLLIVALTVFRVVRFDRLLRRHSQRAPHEIQDVARQIACQLRLNRMPEIRITNVDIFPMVWWVGRRVQVVIPGSLVKQLTTPQWRMVLAHELAHVRRKDYLVRWLEWLTGALFWWNPVVWWARRNLRAAEEICCDLLVLSSLNPDPHHYAGSILNAVESLVCPVSRPPAIASEINSGGFLERRFEMIVTGDARKQISRWSRLAVLSLMLVSLPFGMAYAQDFDKVKKKLDKSVKKGHLTEQQADVMMDTLRRMSDQDPEEAGLKERMRDAGARIRDAIREGEITEAEGKAKLEGLRKRRLAGIAGGLEREHRSDDEELKEVLTRIKKAVAAGELSKEEAEEKVRLIKEKLAKVLKLKEKEKAKKAKDENARSGVEGLTGNWRGNLSEEKLKAISEKLRKAIAEGEITEEDAKRRLGRLLKVMGEQKERKKREDDGSSEGQKEKLRELGGRIRMAIEEGELSEEEGKRKYAAILRELAKREELEKDKERKEFKKRKESKELEKHEELKKRKKKRKVRDDESTDR